MPGLVGVIVTGIDSRWDMDLMGMNKIAKENVDYNSYWSPLIY